MKKYLILTFTAVLFSSSSCTNGQTQEAKTKLTPTEFADKIKATPAAEIVDVRTPEEFSKGHLQNAKNIDWNGDDFDKEIASIDKSKPVFVYCLSGGRSGKAAAEMRSNGYTEVYELEGGIMKWRAENLPETTDNKIASVGMSKNDFDSLLISEKMILVDFYADWCAPCKKMKPWLDSIAKDMADKVVVIRINADDNQAICKELKIDALPVLQLYKNKVLFWSHTGQVDREEVVKELR